MNLIFRNLLQKRLTLEWSKFFCCFLKHTFAKPKKNDIQKNEHFPASIKTRIKKCQYTLRKKNHIFEKSPLPAILCDFTLLTIIEHVFSIFYQKNIDKFTILHRIFVFFFETFSKSLYVSRM